MNNNSNSGNPPSIPTGRRRVPRACDECRKKKIKCDGKKPCLHCTVYSYECTFDQPSFRRRNHAPQQIEALEQKVQAYETLLKHCLPEFNLNRPISEIQREVGSLSKESSPSLTDTLLHGSVEKLGELGLDERGKLEYRGVSSLAAFSRRIRQNMITEGTPQSAAPNSTQTREIQPMFSSGASSFRMSTPTPPPQTHSSHSSQHSQPNRPSHTSHASHASHASHTSQSSTKALSDESPSSSSPNTFAYSKPDSSSTSHDGEKFTQLMPSTYQSKFEKYNNLTNEPFKSVADILPSKEVAKSYIDCCLINPLLALNMIHRPSFCKNFDKLYARMDPEDVEDENYLGFLLMLLCLGNLYTIRSPETAQEDRQVSFKYFSTARRLVDPIEIDDMTSLQTVVLMIHYLQGTSQVSISWLYVGVAMRAAQRMGLHRKLPQYHLKPVEQQVRKLVFWSIYTLDRYMSFMMGLPRGIQDSDIDQEIPLAVDDEFISDEGENVQPLGVPAHTAILPCWIQMMQYLGRISEEMYTVPIERENTVSLSFVMDMERKMTLWQDMIPSHLRHLKAEEHWIKKQALVLQLLFYQTRIMLFRPFLHLSVRSQQQNIDETSSAKIFEFGNKCIDSARCVTKIARQMVQQNMLNGPYWLSMYTTFSAVTILVFVIAEGSLVEDTRELLEEAQSGQSLLRTLSTISQTAHRCSTLLDTLFESLYEVLERKEQKQNISSDVHRQGYGLQSNTPADGKDKVYPHSEALSEHLNDNCNDFNYPAMVMNTQAINSNQDLYFPDTFSLDMMQGNNMDGLAGDINYENDNGMLANPDWSAFVFPNSGANYAPAFNYNPNENEYQFVDNTNFVRGFNDGNNDFSLPVYLS